MSDLSMLTEENYQLKMENKELSQQLKAENKPYQNKKRKNSEELDTLCVEFLKIYIILLIMFLLLQVIYMSIG